MAFSPKMTPCFSNGCIKIKFTDTRGVYSSSNLNGWGSPNIDPSAIQAANIEIIDPTNTSLVVLNVQSSVPETVEGEFYLGEYELDTAMDGEYTFKYTIRDEEGITFLYEIKSFSSCLVRCCIDKMWSKCSFQDDGCCNEKSYYSKAMNAEAIYKTMARAASCNNLTTRNNLLKRLQRICALEKCNCNC